MGFRRDEALDLLDLVHCRAYGTLKEFGEDLVLTREVVVRLACRMPTLSAISRVEVAAKPRATKSSPASSTGDSSPIRQRRNKPKPAARMLPRSAPRPEST